MPPKKGGKKKKEPELQEPEHDGSWEKVRVFATDTFPLGSSCRRPCGAKFTVTSVLVQTLHSATSGSIGC